MLLSQLVIDYTEHQTILNKLALNTRRNYAALLYEFIRWIEAESGVPASLTDLSKRTFVLYIDHVAARVPKRARSIRAAVRSFCRYLIKMEYAEIDITKDVEMPKAEDSQRCAPPDKVIDAMLAAVDRIPDNPNKVAVYRMVLNLLLFAGLRQSEVWAMRVEDIKTATGQIYVQFGKGNKPGYVTPPGEFWPVAKDYLDQRPRNPSDRLLVYSPTVAMGKTGVRTILQKILIAAGYPNEKITPHCLRHAFAMAGLKNGATIKTIQEQLRHSSPATTFGYLRTHEDVTSEQGDLFGRAPSVPETTKRIEVATAPKPQEEEKKQKKEKKPAPVRVRIDLRRKEPPRPSRRRRIAR